MSINLCERCRVPQAYDSIMLGSAFLHLAFETKSPKVFEVVSSVTKQQPLLFGRVIRESLSAWLRAEDEKRAKVTKLSEEDEGVTPKSQKIGRLLAAVFKADDEVDKNVWAELAVEFLVVAHHPEIGEDAQVSWISLVQGVGLDPATVLFDHKEKVLEALWENAGTPPVVSLSLSIGHAGTGLDDRTHASRRLRTGPQRR